MHQGSGGVDLDVGVLGLPHHVGTPAIVYYLPPFFTCPPPLGKPFHYIICLLAPPEAQELFLHLLT